MWNSGFWTELVIWGKNVCVCGDRQFAWLRFSPWAFLTTHLILPDPNEYFNIDRQILIKHVSLLTARRHILSDIKRGAWSGY